MSKFFSKFKGEKDRRDDLTANPPSLSSNNPYRYTQSQAPTYEAPSGLPPSHTSSSEQPKPVGDKLPDDNPPPYHDWTSIPDTALLPPPPAISTDYSPTFNATYEEAAVADAWCARHHVYNPAIPNVHLIEAVQAGQHILDPSNDFRGRIIKTTPTSHPSSFHPNSFGAIPTTVFNLSSLISSSNRQHKSSFSRLLKTPPTNPPTDQTHLTRLPLYFASTSSPLSPHFATSKPSSFAMYFEIRPISFATDSAIVSLGFASKPYPANRQPGWHRASLAIHSDDGNRYVNNGWGGCPFTTPFQAGETLGLAMQFLPEQPNVPSEHRAPADMLQSEREVHSQLPKCKTRVYFTRNGTVQGSWPVDEERDAEKDQGVAGLMGETDLYAAVGTCGGVEVEVRFFRGGEGFVAPPGQSE